MHNASQSAACEPLLFEYSLVIEEVSGSCISDRFVLIVLYCGVETRPTHSNTIEGLEMFWLLTYLEAICLGVAFSSGLSFREAARSFDSWAFDRAFEELTCFEL